MLQNPVGSLPVLADLLVSAGPAPTSTAAELFGVQPNLFQEALDAAMYSRPRSAVQEDDADAGREAASDEQAKLKAPRRESAEDSRSRSTDESGGNGPGIAEPGSARESAKNPDDDEIAVKAEAKRTDKDTGKDRAEKVVLHKAPQESAVGRLPPEAAAEDAAHTEAAAASGVQLSSDKAAQATGPAVAADRVVHLNAGEDMEANPGRRAAVAAMATEPDEADQRVKGESGIAADKGGKSDADKPSSVRLSAERESTDEQKDTGGRGERAEPPEASRNQRRQPVSLEVRDLRREPDNNGAEPNEARGARVESEESGWARRLQADAQRLQNDGGRSETTLSRALREQAHPEIVRQARLVVRGEASGDIRLVLKPEHLGRVRINLHLEDNRIAGRIIVENSSVREAFQENLQALQRSLQQSGIETSGLEVSVGEGGSGNRDHGNQSGLRRAVAAEFDELVPRLGEWYDEAGLVNVYA